MYNATDIAAWLIKRDNIEKHKKNNEPISTLKLMKLLYYVQGAFLAIDNVKIFPEEIHALEYGPAVLEVYNKLKDIDPYNISSHVEVLGGKSIDSNTEELLEEVYQEIGSKFTAAELVVKTHREDPWLRATNNGKLLRNQVIKVDTIKEYFNKYYVEAA